MRADRSMPFIRIPGRSRWRGAGARRHACPDQQARHRTTTPLGVVAWRTSGLWPASPCSALTDKAAVGLRRRVNEQVSAR